MGKTKAALLGTVMIPLALTLVPFAAIGSSTAIASETPGTNQRAVPKPVL